MTSQVEKKKKRPAGLNNPIVNDHSNYKIANQVTQQQEPGWKLIIMLKTPSPEPAKVRD